MKKIISISIFILIFSLTKSQSFFDTDQIQTINLTFNQSNWDTILDSYYTAGSEFRLIAELDINGTVYDSVGVRYKGNSSYNASNNKNPLNIKLDYIKGKQNIEERNVLKLSNVFRDPSFIREVVSYEIARKYFPASKSNFAKVYINGTYIGLYVNDESTNLAFARKHYFKSNDPFFEGDFTPGTPPTGCPSGPPKVMAYLGTDSNCYRQFYSRQSNNPLDWGQLALALDTFNNYPTYIENAVYIDRLLWFLAFQNIMVNLDSPINPPHNFSLYKDNTDRLNPIIWDLNESFGSFNMISGPGGTNLTNTELQELSPWFNASNPNYPIMVKPFAEERNKKMYIAKMKTIYEENIKNDLYRDRASTLQTLISADVIADNNKFYTNAQFTQNLNATVIGRIGVTELMNGRKTYLESQADFLKVAPEVTSVSTSPTEVHSNDAVTISAEVTGANYVFLGYRFSPKEKFTKVQMTASGTTYSTTLNVAYADVQYYIWAENDDAGIFSPERAEYEFHRIGVTGDVVINELQSSNESTQFDEAVEYDDWIELYNNTDTDIDLTGYYLTDNKDTLTKWAIPSQTINADDYAIFWADKDAIQGANHTNFQLTRNGESLYLVNPSKNIINQITYPYMIRDQSYSRFPNGRGAFIEKNPTFKATNGNDSTDGIFNTKQDLYNAIVYPNPSSNTLFLNSSSKIIKNKIISIFDISGKKLIKTIWKSNNTQQIDISTLESGMYFIKIGNTKSLKFVKK